MQVTGPAAFDSLNDVKKTCKKRPAVMICLSFRLTAIKSCLPSGGSYFGKAFFAMRTAIKGVVSSLFCSKLWHPLPDQHVLR